MSLNSIVVRAWQPQDIEAVHALIVELAIYEREPNAVINTPALMFRDGFGENPIFGCFVAEKNNQVVGMAIYYMRYSTWKGRCLYLEDIVITHSERRQGIGELLFNACKAEAQRRECRMMQWAVLDWNEPGITFYKKIGGVAFEPEWVTCKLFFEQT
ncbi:MAG: GNAT family N-acetyltransferase [Cytophagales bacterium]|nr:MAG: GNAT family N-acetyltransferase [Cytophagales bacterium]TAF60776.1 MAG: GNAT family N-acetyltransferase [Cytophagales bacterium]